MPQRPREHQLREESERALRDACPLAWVTHHLDNDYGLDFLIEVFEGEHPTRSASPTGDAFYVQLKGTDESDLSKALRVRLRVDAADYWAAQARWVRVRPE